MKYIVVQNTDRQFFEREVNRLLKDGWKLQGGVSMVILEGSMEHYRYAQAIIKEDDK
jgi:hypothetical protein